MHHGGVNPLEMPPFDVLILAGGAGRRMDGVDKADLEVGGIRLIDRVVEAGSDAGRIVCVGPRRPTRAPVTWTREEPAGGGPAAAVAAGLALVTAPRVVLLAVDLPFVNRALIQRLLRATTERRAAIAIDDGDRIQPLLGCYPVGLLRGETNRSDTRDASMMGLIKDVPHVTVAAGTQARDCDTWDDLEEIDLSSRGGEHGRSLA